MTNQEFLRRLLLREFERMEPNVQTFEDDPIGFLLKKYPSMTQTLEMLMSGAYKDYIIGIYIVAPKPTTFRIVLHNDMDFLLTYLGDVYEANVAGKKFYLQTVGEKERCMRAIARVLALGNPIKTKGPDGGEEPASAGATEDTAEAGATPEKEKTTT